MAQKIVTLLADDITGKAIPAGEGETIEFAVNGTNYTIDLDGKNAKKFHDTIAFYIDHARKLGRTAAPARRAGRARSETDNAAVREWAEANGFEVSARGRIKGEILDAYRAAH